MEFRISIDQVEARVRLQEERERIEADPKGGVLDLEFELASAKDLGVSDPADAEANGDVSGSSSDSSAMIDDASFYEDEADLEERFDEI